MDTPTPRMVTPSSSDSDSLLVQEISLARREGQEARDIETACFPEAARLQHYSDQSDSDTIIMVTPESGAQHSSPETDPPFITQSVPDDMSTAPRPIPLRRATAALGAPPAATTSSHFRVPKRAYHPAPQRQPLPYPDEEVFEPRPAKRRRQEVHQADSGHLNWGQSFRPVQAQRPTSSVYDQCDSTSTLSWDPRAAPRARPDPRPRPMGHQPLPIPTEGRAPYHVDRDHTGPRRHQHKHLVSPSVSTMSSHQEDDGGRSSRSSVTSDYSMRSERSRYMGYSPPPQAGNHPPTGFGNIAQHHEAPHQEDPPVVYGPMPFQCPLEGVELPHAEPLDAETQEVSGKVQALIEAIYLNPVSTAKLESMFETYPRPANLPQLHKTRLNGDVKRQLIKKSREAVVNRDDPLRSLQWTLQFAARPLVEIMSLLLSGDDLQGQRKLITLKMIDAFKFLAKASWKANDQRRYGIYAGLKGAGLEIAQDYANHSSFENLLGDNPKEQIAVRQREDEILREVVAPTTGAQRQGNSKGGHTRGRHNNRNGHQNGRGRYKGQPNQRHSNSNSGQQVNNHRHRGQRQNHGGGNKHKNRKQGGGQQNGHSK
jgi:hypothetical protein